jgi:hypothetical protein
MEKKKFLEKTMHRPAKNSNMPPPTNRTPQAQNFMRKYDKFTFLMVCLACGAYGAEYYLSNVAGKNVIEKESKQKN